MSRTSMAGDSMTVDLQLHFNALADYAFQRLAAAEQMTAWLDAESSDFVRFNHAKIRQAGHAWQAFLRLQLIDSGRHSSTQLNLTGDFPTDCNRIDVAFGQLRTVLTCTPPDPHLLLCMSAESIVDLGADTMTVALPDTRTATAAVMAAAGHSDLVGIWASGPVETGFASSWGQRSFHRRHAFHLDFSVHVGGDKAVKASYAGFEFDQDVLRAKVSDAIAQLALMRRPPRTISPGTYRAWLSPAAVGEVMGLVAWDSFGLKLQRTRQSALQRIVDGVAQLSPLVHLTESPATGVAPRFGSAGFHRPEKVALLRDGRHAGSLVSPRSAQEYGAQTTGGAESPDSLVMAPGQLPDADVLAALGTGVWVGNLWYTNWSDRPAGRLTGMTRFATFWVEQGEIVAPLSVMRFDDSLERMLGSELEALGSATPLQLSADTYERRSTSSVRLPGALLRGFQLTL